MISTEKRLLATLDEARIFATQEMGIFRRPIVPAPEFDRHPRIATQLEADAKARGGTLAELVNAAWQDGFVDVSAPFDEGQRLWVAEACAWSDSGPKRIDTGLPFVVYRADGEIVASLGHIQGPPVARMLWTPSTRMPRWASRLTLEVTGVTVEQNNGLWEWAFAWKRVAP